MNRILMEFKLRNCRTRSSRGMRFKVFEDVDSLEWPKMVGWCEETELPVPDKLHRIFTYHAKYFRKSLMLRSSCPSSYLDTDSYTCLTYSDIVLLII